MKQPLLSLLLLLLWLSPLGAKAERVVWPMPHEVADTTELSSAQSDRFYDSLRIRSERSRWSKTLYRALVKSERDSVHHEQVYDEEATLSPYAGRRIREVRIERLLPFDSEEKGWERVANHLHTLTREQIIRRDLLFAAGDRLDPYIIARNKHLLQSRRYISDVAIDIELDPSDSTQVDLVVRTRDSWTVDVDGSVRSKGEASVGLSESNLLGRGHLLRLETNLDYRNPSYEGNVVEYSVPNLRGSFYTFDFAAGRSFSTSRLQAGVQKEFIRPTDYMLGLTWSNNKVKHHFVDRDTSELVKARNLDFWSGYSYRFEPIDASLYAAFRYNRRRFSLRPEDTAPQRHPLLHDGDALLVNLGLYREHFFSANMIYGYGQREYLVSGFRSELTGGYLWGEFDDTYYMALSHTMGGYTRIGYLMGQIRVGGYNSTATHQLSRGQVDLALRWFSRLYEQGRSRQRYFISLGYTYGWDRLTGADECISFTNENGLHALEEHLTGINRLVVNTESVYFTPYQPLGFKVAVFSFCDVGVIGYDDNIFRNDPFCSLGVGVRVRNERLVFKAIQLRLGVAFGRGGLAESRYFRFSSASALQQYRYRPLPPEMLNFE